MTPREVIRRCKAIHQAADRIEDPNERIEFLIDEMEVFQKSDLKALAFSLKGVKAKQ